VRNKLRAKSNEPEIKRKNKLKSVSLFFRADFAGTAAVFPSPSPLIMDSLEAAFSTPFKRRE